MAKELKLKFSESTENPVTGFIRLRGTGGTEYREFTGDQSELQGIVLNIKRQSPQYSVSWIEFKQSHVWREVEIIKEPYTVPHSPAPLMERGFVVRMPCCTFGSRWLRWGPHTRDAVPHLADATIFQNSSVASQSLDRLKDEEKWAAGAAVESFEESAERAWQEALLYGAVAYGSRRVSVPIV